MIKTIDDLRKCYAVREDKEVFELFMDKCEEFGITWGNEEPRAIKYGGAVVFDGAYMDNLGHGGVSFMEQAGYKRLTLSDFKPTRTEYIQVTESIFDLRDEFERGELFMKGRGAGSDFFNKITTEYELVTFASRGLYRKVEKEIDWRDDIYEWQYTKKVGIYTPLDFTVAHLISAHPDKFLELCRVALRANGEIE